MASWRIQAVPCQSFLAAAGPAALRPTCPHNGAIMNTLGKLLVIVNLLFALATGGFLAVDFASRTEWKAVADARGEELDVIRKNSDGEGKSRIKARAGLRR